MRTSLRLALLIFVLFVPALARGQHARMADVEAVQDAVRHAIDKAEPSIACVLVSRSEKYRSLLPVVPDVPGQLGRFDLRPRTRRLENDPEYQELTRLDLSDPNNVPETFGSGVVIDEREGLILTLAHVVKKATKIYVRLPGGKGSWADIHALDTRSDLAVLRLLDRLADLKAISFGEGGKLRKGDFILSLSNPFAAGFRDGSPSASWGIVSNLRRRATGIGSDVPTIERNANLPFYCFGTLIQTDARIDLGCSGGALLNLRGELVGLTTAFAGIAGGETPGGFAVPLDDGMRRVIEVLRRGEEVEYGFMGVYLMGSDKVKDGYVQLSSVVEDGPAARGGLRGGMRGGDFGPRFPRREVGGDYVLSINGIPVHSNDELFHVVGMQLAGSTVRVEVATNPPDEGRRACQVTLAKFPTLDPIIVGKKRAPVAGLRVDWTSTLPIENYVMKTGVVIREVLPQSAAEQAHLKTGMIIRKVNQHDVLTPADFYREMKRANGSAELTFGFSNDREQHVTISTR